LPKKKNETYIKDNVTKMKHSQYSSLLSHTSRSTSKKAKLILHLQQHNTATKDQSKNITAPF
jgi:hypothetical protein